MKIIYEKLATGMVTSDGDITYKSFIINGNFFVYRYVDTESRYRGNKYTELGYVLVFADNQRPPYTQCPGFVSIEQMRYGYGK